MKICRWKSLIYTDYCYLFSSGNIEPLWRYQNFSLRQEDIHAQSSPPPLSFMDEVLSEKRQLMNQVGKFQVGSFWVGIFRGEFGGWEISWWGFSYFNYPDLKDICFNQNLTFFYKPKLIFLEAFVFDNIPSWFRAFR